ncbi:hypothetical protein HC248_01501 [Polaromonas vacuolata]|uniref:Uncharacterized protein n=1 Tax=Polaromonas vacuolata TaxID=37448 RepID=A0A6H2H8J9_9BURK|nr:hypothetical protein [Polaromonas vacuolata]QJC56199.1 hypothetical protein HC248_01501 [Polaromonas vacuolata]
MPIRYKKNQALFEGVATVDDAEGLQQWLKHKPHATVHLTACSHLHSANLQVLMAAGNRIAAWPDDTDLHCWLETLLSDKK